MDRRRDGEPMPSLEERIAYLEGRIEDHTGAVAELRSDVREVRVEVRDLRIEFRESIGALRGELRIEVRQLGERLDNRIDGLDSKISRHFTWLVGIQIAALVAIIGALVGR